MLSLGVVVVIETDDAHCCQKASEDGAEPYSAVSTAGMLFAYVSILLHYIANNTCSLTLMKERTRPLHTFHARLSSRPIMRMADVAVCRCFLATGMDLLRKPVSVECEYV